MPSLTFSQPAIGTDQTKTWTMIPFSLTSALFIGFEGWLTLTDPLRDLEYTLMIGGAHGYSNEWPNLAICDWLGFTNFPTLTGRWTSVNKTNGSRWLTYVHQLITRWNGGVTLWTWVQIKVQEFYYFIIYWALIHQNLQLYTERVNMALSSEPDLTGASEPVKPTWRIRCPSEHI